MSFGFISVMQGLLSIQKIKVIRHINRVKEKVYL